MSGVKPITIERCEDYLRQESVNVTEFNEYLTWEAALLKKYAFENDKMAVSAIQIGIPKRIIYFKNDNHGELVIINPTIIERKGLTKSWELCLSCGNLAGNVRRPYEIALEYQDINGEIQVDLFQGYEATVLSHELNHLDGILHIDLADDIVEVNNREYEELKKEEPYTVLDEQLDYDNLLIEETSPIIKVKR